MVGVNFKKSLTTVLFGLLVLLLLYGTPAIADDETTTEGVVEVLPGEAGSYGASVIESQRTLFPSSALGEPDGRGAFIFWNGWISMELEGSVLNAHTISIWAANRGWWPSNMKIYVSADGSEWMQVGEKVVSAGFLRYDFSGSFGDVRYIKVSRSGGRWSFLRLDAVCAKGGD